MCAHTLFRSYLSIRYGEVGAELFRSVITIREILLVGAGGFAGSVGRFALSTALAPGAVAAGFPLATFTVNITGSLLIGIFMGATANMPLLLLLATGFCGGFTTFSTFSAETLGLLREGNLWTAAGYALASVAVCVAMAMAGIYLAAKLR